MKKKIKPFLTRWRYYLFAILNFGEVVYFTTSWRQKVAAAAATNKGVCEREAVQFHNCEHIFIYIYTTYDDGREVKTRRRWRMVENAL